MDMSEHTCGVAFDGAVPEVALDKSEFLDNVVRCPFVQRQVLPMVQTVLFRGDSAVAVYRPGRRLPCRGAEAFTVQTVVRTIAIPQSFLDKVVNAPVMQVCRPSKSLSWRRDSFPWSSRP